MSKGRILSYWRDEPGKEKSIALFAKVDGPWMLVGIYEKHHLQKILLTTYANWPKDSLHQVVLP